MSWISVYRCVKCKKRLSQRSRMYNHGTCPLCGNYTPGTGTIVDCDIRPERSYSLFDRVAMLFGRRI